MEEKLKNILREHGAESCSCGHELGFGDIAWNEGQTEAGTPASWIQIQCLVCQRENAWIHSWTWFDEELSYEERTEKILSILEKDWRQK